MNWGPWDGGMVTGELRRIFEKNNVALIPAPSGAEALLCLDVSLQLSRVLGKPRGQLRATHALLGDPDFWHDEVGVPPPSIEGLGTATLLRVTC